MGASANNDGDQRSLDIENFVMTAFSLDELIKEIACPVSVKI